MTENARPHLPFGFLRGNEVKLVTFGPDDEDLLWFVDTDEVRLLDGLVKLGDNQQHYSGRCVDTSEYISPFAQAVSGMLEDAPLTTELATIYRDGGVGTRTWYEDITVTFYGQPSESEPSSSESAS